MLLEMMTAPLRVRLHSFVKRWTSLFPKQLWRRELRPVCVEAVRRFFIMEERNMKKLLSLLLALTMVFALAACGTTTPPDTTEPPVTTNPP